MVQIINMEPRHWEDARNIYLKGIATGQATFQQTAQSWEDWDSAHSVSCRLIGVENDITLGWAALTPVPGRCVYAGVAEVSHICG